MLPVSLLRRSVLLTDPMVPLVVFTGSLVAGTVLASEVVAWAAFGALAGYSLSGST